MSNENDMQAASDSATPPTPISIDRLQRLAAASNTLNALLAWDLATTVPHAQGSSLTVELKLRSGQQYQPTLWLPSQKLEELLTTLTTEILSELEASGIDVKPTLTSFQEAATKLLNPSPNKE